MIFHFTHSSEWQDQAGNPRFEPVDYAREGFIHCCEEGQIKGVLERYFAGAKALNVLHIDESKLTASLRYEANSTQEKFPHVYGPINKGAVVKVTAANS